MLATRMIETLQRMVLEEGDFELDLPNGKPITRITMLPEQHAPTKFTRSVTVKPTCTGKVGIRRCVLEVGHTGLCRIV